jgi:protein-disulfide isomerase
VGVSLRALARLGIFALVVASARPAAAQPATAGPLAEVNGEAITADEVEAALGAPLRRLEQQVYDLKRRTLDALIGERLLAREAATRGLSVPALVDAEVTAKAAAVTDDDVERFFQANKARLPGDEAEVRERVRFTLRAQNVAVRREAFLNALRSQASVVVHLQAPAVVPLDFTLEGAPSRGPSGAPVTIVEYTDFHCPFCKRVLPALTRLLSRYGDKVRLVFRDFPIDRLHPGARKAAEAARCAHDQGRFWDYHDRLFASAPRSSGEHLVAHARQLGLDVTTFERCLASGTHAARVQQSVDEGIRVGVTGTPAFFINGRLLSGAQPLEHFVRLVEEALAAGQSPSPASRPRRTRRHQGRPSSS